MIDGLLILDKPPRLTSARAVSEVKRLLPRGVKIGHAGTLDPFATGILILLVGKATRLCEHMMSQRKTYHATVKLGATTRTDDPESPEQSYAMEPVALTAIREILPRFIGAIQQRPPIYSAIKIRGRRACDRVRAGDQVELNSRTVHVYSLRMVDYTWPLLRLEIICGRGTYIRSIARDLGEALGCGGYLTELRRTRIGEYGMDRAVELEQLSAENITQHLEPGPRA